MDSTRGRDTLPTMTKRTTPWRPRPLPTSISSNDWRGRRRRVLERDAYACVTCGSITYGQDAYVDLIVPICEGACEHDDGWYGVFCGPCYVEKKHRERERWRGRDGA